jgi:hypothetical protein
LDKELHRRADWITVELLAELIQGGDGLTSHADDSIADSKAGFPCRGLVRHIDDREAETSTLNWFDDQTEVSAAGCSLGDLAVAQKAIAEDFCWGFGGRRWRRYAFGRLVWIDFAWSDDDRGLGPPWAGTSWILGDRKFFGGLDDHRRCGRRILGCRLLRIARKR